MREKRKIDVAKGRFGISRHQLEGKIFGRLTVKYQTGKKNKKREVLWHCICECGNELDVATGGLIKGQCVSCGCRQRELQADIHNKLHCVEHTIVEFLEKRNYRSDNTSGRQGVHLQKSGRYKAYIGFNGKRYHLGYFDTFEEAVVARREAEEVLHKAFIERYYQWKEKAGDDPEWALAHPLCLNVELDEETKGVRIAK